MREYQRTVQNILEYLTELLELTEEESEKHKAYDDMINSIIATCYKEVS